MDLYKQAMTVAETFDVSSPENSVVLYSISYLPTTHSGWNDPTYQAFVAEKFPTAVKSYESQANTPESCYNAWLPMFTDFHALCAEWYSFACNNLDVSPEEVTQRYAEAVDECIELYRLQYGL